MRQNARRLQRHLRLYNDDPVQVFFLFVLDHIYLLLYCSTTPGIPTFHCSLLCSVRDTTCLPIQVQPDSRYCHTSNDRTPESLAWVAASSGTPLCCRVA